MKEKPLNLLPPTLLLALSALLSRALGVWRDHLLAKTFGATAGEGIYNLDVYYAAFRVPDLLYNLLIFGSISAAFIPIFTQHKKAGDQDGMWAFANSMLHLMMIAVLVIAGAAYALAPYLVYTVAGGFEPEPLALTVKLMRLMLLSPILFAASSIIISLQDSFKTFFFRSLGPLFYNAGIIAGVVFFGAEFGVVGVTWGVILGAALQLFIQLPALPLMGFRYRFVLGWKRPDVRKALRLMGPRVLGLGLFQITMMANTLIASFLATGSLTVFYLADNLQAVPLGLIGISFAIASFATLSELAGEPTTVAFTGELRRIVGKVLFLIVPASVGLFLLRREVIEVILMNGKFSAGDAALTATVLGWMIVSLFAQSLIPTLGRGFYAYHDTKTPLSIAVIGSFIDIGGSLLLAFYWDMGIAGVAMAFSAGAIAHAALLLRSMRRRLGHAIVRGRQLAVILAGSAVMMAGVQALKDWLAFEGDIFEKIILLAIYTTAGAALYFGFMRLPFVAYWTKQD